MKYDFVSILSSLGCFLRQKPRIVRVIIQILNRQSTTFESRSAELESSTIKTSINIYNISINIFSMTSCNSDILCITGTIF